VRAITTTKVKLVWREAERLKNRASHIPCYEAGVEGGKYRAAPVVYFPSFEIGYEAFFIPTKAKSMADVRDIAENLKSIDEAKDVAERDYANRR
jgi:hypothetical protein